MYQSVIGKRLVACVNRRDGSNYSVREFFDTVYVPLFYANDRLLQHVNNSPFDQKLTKKKLPFTISLGDECLRIVHNNVEHKSPDASFYLGGPASGSVETTSGQVTSLTLPIDADEIYASWIGAALGLMVSGAMTLLIDSEDVILATYDGWREYRRFLDQTPKVKGMQINTWNGQWVASKMRATPFFAPSVDQDGSALSTQKWVDLLFSLSFYHSNRAESSLLAYVYSLGQMNTTLGFVRLNLFEARRLIDVYQKFFTVPEGLPPRAFEGLYQTAFSFMKACEYPQIGLKALKPRDLFQAERGVPKYPDASDPSKRISFDIYQTWIIAMLNNKELLPKAQELATALYAFRQSDERGKSVNTNLVDTLLAHKNRRDFIDGLTEILNKDPRQCDLFEQIVENILTMSHDNVPLFLSLVRFKYSTVKAKA